MEPKNNFELDISMESKSRYKLRSSLKKRKSRNPLGSLDITEVNADSTLAPPQRRVSFASSNYVKPFMDDPEKNTIWDNTYEEEVNHTDSTKSENTNQPNLSDLRSHCQEITNLDVDKEYITNIYCDPSVVDMEVSYFDQTFVNDKIRNSSGESDLDITSSFAANVDAKDITELSKETTFNMELTCQWKNNIMQSSIMLKNQLTTNKTYLRGNATVRQEEDMSMTCCFDNDDNLERGILAAVVPSGCDIIYGGEENTVPRHGLGNEMESVGSFSNKTDQPKEIASNFTPQGVENKENIATVYAKKDIEFLPDQSEMEFTCAFPNNILEPHQPQGIGVKNNSPAMTGVSTNVENKENIAGGYTKKDKVFFPDQSEMEFTCAFPNNILETVNQSKRTRDNSPAMIAVSTNVEITENLATVLDIKDKVVLPDQSAKILSCGFPNVVLETVNQSQGTRDNSPARIAVGTNMENKENIATVLVKDKVLLPDQNEMKFTCAFPNNILETHQPLGKAKKSNSPAMTGVSTNMENKEKIAGGYTKKLSKGNVFFPDQSEMEFTCAFPNNILETHPSQGIAIKSNSPAMTGISTNMENKENIAGGYTKKLSKENVFFPDQSEMEFTCAFPNNILETHPPQGIAAVNAIFENKENIATVYAKKDEVSCPCQIEMQFPISNNILETSQPEGAKTVIVHVQNKENIPMVYSQKEKNKDSILAVALPRPGPPIFGDDKENAFSPHQREMEFASVEPLGSEIPSKNISGIAKTSVSENDEIEVKKSLFGNLSGCLPTGKLEKIQPTLNNEDELCPRQRLTDNIYSTEKTMNIKTNSLCILPLRKEPSFGICQDLTASTDPAQGDVHSNLEFKQIEDVKFIKPNDNTEVLKPVKVREFGNIPIAVDITDSSIDQGDVYSNSKFKQTENVKFIKPKVNTEGLKPVKVREFGNIPIAVDVTDSSMDQGDVYSNLKCKQTEDVNFIKPKVNTEVLKPVKVREFGNIPIAVDITDSSIDQGDVYSNSKFKQTEDVKFIKPKVNTEVLKPVKVKEFGNIPMVVDVTDLSMDQHVNERDKPLFDTSKRPYDSKENTYTISYASPKATKVQIIKDPLSQSNKVDSHDNQMYANGSGENVSHKSIRATDTPKQSITKRQDKITSKLISNIKPDLPSPILDEQKSNNELYLLEGFNEKPDKYNLLSESVNPSIKYISEESARNQQINKTQLEENQNQIVDSPKDEKVEYICAEECTLVESMEGSILINSITVPDVKQHNSLDVNLYENIQREESLIDEDCHLTARGLQLGEQMPATKVIYSEPMKVKPFHDEYPSMQTSGLNPFSFGSIASMEDTQQLIQTTFSKPCLAKLDQFESDSTNLPESSMLENSESNAINKSDSVIGIGDETRKYQSVLKNIHKKLFVAKFQPFNYKEIADSIKANRELSENMEKLLLNYKFPEIDTFTLQEQTKKLSLCNISGDSSESMLDVLEFVEDNNCNKSVLLEPIKSLHDKIVDVCTRSNKVLNIKHFKGSSYIFSIMYECVLIYVLVHPDDGRVTEIKTASSLDDSMDILNHFLVKNILDKLKHSTLKSCLGPYYDVLSLLDHICLTVDEVMDFHFEFLSLQKLYPTLKINDDYSVAFEVLHISPPIWWLIRINVTSVNKINNPENLHMESKWGHIREAHIKEILRNIDDGVYSLRTFISDVFKYLDRTKLRFKV